ncbi:small ribosomal subunit protein uS15m [Strix aluco]|uniref:small ribosomal subunit protein uS15m n=1 Tax=Strix aluco TaxID=111821 RepID=UPI003DA6B06B
MSVRQEQPEVPARRGPSAGTGRSTRSALDRLDALGARHARAKWRRPWRRGREGSAMLALRAALGRCLAGPARGGAAVLGSARGGDGAVCSPFIQAARWYARPVRRRKDIPSHLDDLPPTMLKKDYANVPIINSVDDVVKRLLSLEMASQKEKMKIKIQQLVEKVRRSPNDNGSSEVQVAVLTAKIRTYEEHLQRHPKDKNNRRRMLMAMDRRNKLLAYLRRVRYDTFENTCKQLNIQYSLPPPYCRRITKRWLVKKAFCIKVFQEVQKLKAPQRLKERRERQARARAAKEAAAQHEGTPV